MKLAVLFSGGKDSGYSLYKAMQKEKVVCLISLISENKESYMFHTPNIELVELQSKLMNIPLVKKRTKGKKESELKDLEKAIRLAVKKHKIEGIVTGAINSVYQSSRMQKICRRLKLWCFNPLWQVNQEDYLKELIKNEFEIIITGVSAYPFDESYLGRKIDNDIIKELIELKNKYHINPAFEGGEGETLVVNCPLFKKRIEILESEKEYKNHSGIYIIKKAR